MLRARDELLTLVACGTSGALVWAGGSLSVGTGAGDLRDTTPFAAGWLVARGDVTVNTQWFVGAILSREGSVRGSAAVLAWPAFTQASLYLPREPQGPTGPPTWMARQLDFHYGRAADSQEAVDVGPEVFTPGTWSWTP